MKLTRLPIAVAMLLSLCSCAYYTLVEPGTTQYAGLKIESSVAWNRAPSTVATMSREHSQLLTQDGLLLDRLIIIPAVPEGEPIFKQRSSSQALPVFKLEMNPKEIEELTESSIVKLFGEGEVAVETTRLRPHRFGVRRGFMFDIEMAVNDGPDYGGFAGAFVAKERLYLVIFLGAQPYYFEKHKEEALAIIEGAVLSDDGLLGAE